LKRDPKLKDPMKVVWFNGRTNFKGPLKKGLGQQGVLKFLFGG
jgi:hypothetical protein